MVHRINPQLEEGTFRIVCPECGHILLSNTGDLTTAALVSMQYESRRCTNCGCQYVLETNPEPHPNRYDANHPYPNNIN